jgi:hypothetical protein
LKPPLAQYELPRPTPARGAPHARQQPTRQPRSARLANAARRLFGHPGYWQPLAPRRGLWRRIGLPWRRQRRVDDDDHLAKPVTVGQLGHLDGGGARLCEVHALPRPLRLPGPQCARRLRRPAEQHQFQLAAVHRREQGMPTTQRGRTALQPGQAGTDRSARAQVRAVHAKPRRAELSRSHLQLQRRRREREGGRQ